MIKPSQVMPLPVPVIPAYEVHHSLQGESETAVIDASNELLSIIEEFNNSENECGLYEEEEDDDIEIIHVKAGDEFDYSTVKIKIEPID